jgi:hypothetical protein
MLLLIVSDGQIATVDCSLCYRVSACADKPEAFIRTNSYCKQCQKYVQIL